MIAEFSIENFLSINRFRKSVMNDFEEHIRQGEPQKREKGYAWQTGQCLFKNLLHMVFKVQILHFGRDCCVEFLARTPPSHAERNRCTYRKIRENHQDYYRKFDRKRHH